MHHDESLSVSEYAGVCVAIWRSDVTQALFECQRAGLRSVIRAYPGNAGFMCVIEDGVKPPSDELRKASAAMVRDAAPDLRRIACVIEATGFLAALTRSVLSGMQLVAGRKANVTAFFASVGDAAKWLSEEYAFDTETFEKLIAERRADPTPSRHASSR
ncbi:MAG: hypothetical protein ABW352_12775 [Polyangiales bacterium]